MPSAGSGGGPVPGAPSDNTTLLTVLEDLRVLGYTEDIQVSAAGELCCHACGHCVAAADMELLELRRVEGASDPADMAAVLGVQCAGCQRRGAAVVRFGPEAGPGEELVLRELPDRR